MAVPQSASQDVRDFVRTPFAVRCNVVKVWRPLPAGIWQSLSSPTAQAESRRRERWALVGVLLMTVFLLGLGGVGHVRAIDGQAVSSTVLTVRPHTAMTVEGVLSGWFFCLGSSMWIAVWITLLPLVGWWLVRCVWIPVVVAGTADRDAAISFARHLSGVYFYVYLMIAVGGGLAVALVALAPTHGETLRCGLWWFLLGESFFVPAVMWLRLILDRQGGVVFGGRRRILAGLYVVFFVLLPVAGMGVRFACDRG